MSLISDSLRVAKSLSLFEVRKSFHANGSADGNKVVVLDGVTMSLKSGSMVGLIGETGSGKTTISRILSGVLRPDSGSVHVGELALLDISESDQPELRHYLRFVPQNPDAVAPHGAKVAALLDEAASVSRLDADSTKNWYDRIRSSDLIERDLYREQFGNLSLGERRRVVNVRGLLTCPKFLVMDEPFNGLDVMAKTRMIGLLRDLVQEQDSGVLIVSHDVDTLTEMCDQMLELENGKLKLLQ